MLHQLQPFYQLPEFLSILQIQELIHLLLRSLYGCFISDPLQTHLSPLKLKLQPRLVVAATGVEDH